MRFILIIVILVLAALAGLYVYGSMLKQTPRTIEQEAVHAEGA